jgi:chromosome segregation ATPase
MLKVLKQRGETISKLKDLNADLEHRLRETNSKLETVQGDLKIKLSEFETKDKALCDLKMDLAKVTQIYQENIEVKNETILTLEKEVMKFMECQHELETKTSALEAKEERIHNLEAELTKHADTLQDLISKEKIICDLEEEIKNLKAGNKAGNQEGDGSSAEDHNGRVKELQDEISALRAKIQVLERETEEVHKENGKVSKSTVKLKH